MYIQRTCSCKFSAVTPIRGPLFGGNLDTLAHTIGVIDSSLAGLIRSGTLDADAGTLACSALG